MEVIDSRCETPISTSGVDTSIEVTGAYVTSQSVLYPPFDYDCPLSEGSRRDSLTLVHFSSEVYG